LTAYYVGDIDILEYSLDNGLTYNYLDPTQYSIDPNTGIIIFDLPFDIQPESIRFKLNADTITSNINIFYEDHAIPEAPTNDGG
jgi:hypothetical protein